MANEDHILVVKKKKSKKHGGHHGGAWKVAYADFVTAMMALFIVLWILGQNEEMKVCVAAYFQNPKAYDQALASGKFKVYLHSDIYTPEEIYNVPPPSPPVAQYPVNSDRDKMEEFALNIKNKINSLPEFDNLKDKVVIQVKEDMAIIELIEPEESYFFDMSNSNLKPKAKKILGLIAKELNKFPYCVVIGGHTDSHPFVSGSKYYSNWELSAERANSARRIFEEYGYDPVKILEVRGYADKSLKYPNDPFNPMNRRISIIVYFGKVVNENIASQLEYMSINNVLSE